MLPRSPLLAALRRLGRRPAFLALAIGTLALGIGATTAMFAVVQAVLLRPLPYPHPDRLVALWSHAELPARQGGSPLSRNEALEYGERARVFSAFAALGWTQATLLGGDEPRQVTAAGVMHPFFAALGVQPLLGRVFHPTEDAPGRDDAVMLSHALWLQAFGGDASALGRKVVVDGRPRVVVGVMPAGFGYPRGAALWLPLALDRAALDGETLLSHGLQAVGRLRPGITTDQAEADLDRVVRELAGVHPAHFATGDAVRVVSLEQQLLGAARPPLVALLAAVGFLLLLACANVANLMLLRGEQRRRELAVRRALGAGPGRLLRELLAEALLMSLAAATLSVLATRFSLVAIRTLLPADLPRVDDLAVDWRVLGFALLLALLTTLLVSLAPAWRAGRRGEAGELRGAASGRGAGRLADGLVVGQVALALALCAGSALAGRSLQRLTTVDTGFAGEGALTARVSLPAEGRYGSEVGVQAFFRTLQERLATDPRVVAVGAASWLPFVDSPSDWPVEVEGIPAPAWGEDEAPTADYTLVSGDYLQAMGAPLLSGRLLRPDDEGGLRKAVVTASFVRRYLGGREPLGRRLRLAGDPTSYEIVGVVADQRLRGSTATPRQGVFLPLAELRTGAPWLPRTMALVVRSQGEPEALLATTRRVLRELDPLLPLADVRTLSELRRADLAEPRSLVGLLGLFAALGLVLGGVGTFSVAAAWVAHGRRDIGVRMAIGADARRVVGEVLGRGLRLTALGCVLGGVVAWRAALAAGERLLFEVAPSDPVAFGGAALTLLLVGALATGVPARRASRIEPMRVLREG